MKRVILTILAMSSLAYAGDKEKADSLFKQGKKLMGEKKYSDACDAFEQSMKLDPGIGTELNIARCYEEWGKVAHAYNSYKSALKMAKDASDSRADKIEGLINQLEPSVPKLKMHVPKDADTSSVTIDGAPVDDISQPILLDPGPHKVEYTAAAGGKKSKTIPIEKGGSYDANLLDLPAKPGEVDHKPPPPPPPPPPHVSEQPDPGKNYRLAAYGLGGAGVVAIGISSYMTLSAKSKYNDALKTHCGGMTNACDPTGLTQTHDARHEANIATIVFSVGLAAVGGGVALYLLQPHAAKGDTGEKADEALYLVPSVTPEGAGLVFGGGF